MAMLNSIYGMERGKPSPIFNRKSIDNLPDCDIDEI